MHQIKDHKKQIESRLQMLRKITSAKGSVTENMLTLKLNGTIEATLAELSMIVKTMNLNEFAEDKR